MSRLLSVLLGIAVVGVFLVPGTALGENQGLPDLDKALEAKLTAATITDLALVIRLCESALEKGLNESNQAFAQQLLASTRIDRGMRIAEAILTTMPPPANWPQFRQVALKDLKQGVEIDSQQPQALYMIARLNLLPGGNAKQAIEAIDQALKLSGDDSFLLAKCLVLKAGMEKEEEKKLALLDEALAANANDVDALRMRGSLNADNEDYEKSLPDLLKAAELSPEHAPTHHALGLVFSDMQRNDEALKSFSKVHELAPKSAAPLVQIGRLHALDDDFEKARDVLDEAFKLEPGNVGVLLLRATVCQELGENEKALADIDQVLKIKPDMPMAMRFRAMLLAGSGDLDTAIGQLEDLLETEPEDIEVLLQLAFFYSAEKRSLVAIEKFNTVLAKDAQNVAALRGRGDANLNIGKHAEAIADLSKALELEPENDGILNNLAWVLCTSPVDELRDGRRAVELATKACELTEFRAAHILSTLAAAHAETGDMETALKWSRKAVELGDESVIEDLSKELESYQQGKPWRELMTPEPEEEEKEEEKEEGKEEKEEEEEEEEEAVDEP